MEKEAEKNTALADILQTREVRQTLSDVLPDVLDVFAKESKIGKLILKQVGNFLKKRLARPQDSSGDKELQRLFADQQFIKNISEPLPDMMNGLFDIMGTLARTLEEMPAAEKKKLFGNVFKGISSAQAGEMINRGCRNINSIHKVISCSSTHINICK